MSQVTEIEINLEINRSEILSFLNKNLNYSINGLLIRQMQRLMLVLVKTDLLSLGI